MTARSTLSLPRHAKLPAVGRTGAAGESARAAIRLQSAMNAMQQCRWPEAFEQFASLADEGHPHAARVALLFAQRGTRLFGGRYTASAEQMRAWSRIAA